MNQYLLRRALIGTCVALALINGIAFLFFQSYDHTAIDFRVFWQSSRVPPAMVYSNGVNPFINPPSALIFFKPLSLFDLGPAFVGWVALSLAAYFLAARRAVGTRWALVSLLSLTVIAALKVGQVSLILAALIVLAFTLRPVLCGVLLGIVLSIKPQLIFLAPLALIVRRDWLAIGAMGAAFLVTVAAELALFGPGLWFEWVASLPKFLQRMHDFNLLRYMITPAGIADYHGLPRLPFLLAGAALGCLSALCLARKLEGADLAALIVASSLVASPYALPHDMAAMVPACVVAIWKRPGIAAIPAMAVFLGVLPGFALLLWMLAAWASDSPLLDHFHRHPRIVGSDRDARVSRQT